MAGGSADAGDEEVIEGTIDEMLGMCGNAGQETLINRNAQAFFDWSLAALEEEGAFDSFDGMLSNLDVNYEDHSLQGTMEIWQYGYQAMVGQSSFHDGFDEQGEGTGDNVASGKMDF